jgi:excisionase family DNA binding protein
MLKFRVNKTSKTSKQYVAKKSETQTIRQLERILNAEHTPPRLISSDGEEILLPESVYEALCQVIEAMASGQAITIVPHDREMTTQQAADFLNVSRPYLIKLLEQEVIPHIKVGAHRRVRARDIMMYKQQRDTQRQKNLSEFTAFLQDEGFYDEKNPDIDL